MRNLKIYGPFFVALIAACYLYLLAPRIELMDYRIGVAAILFIVILFGIFRVAYFADHLAEMLGEPYGTLLLTISATLIEVAVMITALTHGDGNPTFVRDTITATLFIVLGGMMGLSTKLPKTFWNGRSQLRAKSCTQSEIDSTEKETFPVLDTLTS